MWIGQENVFHLSNELKKAKKTLDIAIFALTNDTIKKVIVLFRLFSMPTSKELRFVSLRMTNAPNLVEQMFMNLPPTALSAPWMIINVSICIINLPLLTNWCLWLVVSTGQPKQSPEIKKTLLVHFKPSYWSLTLYSRILERIWETLGAVCSIEAGQSLICKESYRRS